SRQPVTRKGIRFNCYENGQLKREVCGGDFAATIQRSQFGLGFLPNVTPDAVPLLIQVEAIREYTRRLLVRFEVSLRILVDLRHAGEVARLEQGEGDGELVTRCEVGV